MSGTFKEVEKTPTLVFGEMPDMKEKAELDIIPEKKEEEMDDMRIMYLLTQCAKAQNALEVAKGKHN